MELAYQNLRNNILVLINLFYKTSNLYKSKKPILINLYSKWVHFVYRKINVYETLFNQTLLQSYMYNSVIP